MAKSPAHRFGQIIGDLLELTMIEYCRPIAQKYGLYLDYRHSRIARNNQNEVRWKDINGNTHKLDIVMESNGSEEQFGQPRVFIEIAWRRYTKHSKNKAQEISAAINPLISKYKNSGPFFGAVLAGDFTQNSLTQLKSEGFEVLYFSLDAIKSAFEEQKINAYWEEGTPEDELQSRINQFEALSLEEVKVIKDKLLEDSKDQLDKFVKELTNSLERRMESICIISLYGNSQVFNSVDDACKYILEYNETVTFSKESFYRYEIVIKYTNGDKIDMQFKEQQPAIIALKTLV